MSASGAELFGALIASAGSELARKQAVQSVLACNEKSAQYALTLTEKEAAELVETKNESLKENGIIEFKPGITELIIRTFCDSPYLDCRNYASSLNELVDIFFTLKRECEDSITDIQAVKFLKYCFDNVTGGDLDSLGDCVSRLLRHLNAGKKIETFSFRDY